MTNPVKQNAGQLPSPATPFFNSDGKTISSPYRAFLRSLALLTGLETGGTDISDLVKQLALSLADMQGSDAASVAIPFMPAISPLEVQVPAHGIQDEPDLHAVATDLLAGFMSAADKTKLDGIQVPIEDIFVAGPGFTPGTTTSLTLSKAYAAKAAVTIHFDGTFQGTDQYSLLGTTITFTSAIPLGTTTVYARG
jgi:hypothetical protein